MSIVVIVNLIVSLSLILGGVCMKKVAKVHADYTIGYRTKRAMSSEETWSFANQRCGNSWVSIGMVGFVLAMTVVFFVPASIGGYVQTAVLIFQIAGVIATVTVIENQMKSKFGK